MYSVDKNDRINQDRQFNNNQQKYVNRNFFDESTRTERAKFGSVNVGEITGEKFPMNDIEYGMPMRSSFIGKKMNNNNTNHNRSDFDLFDVKSDFTVSYNDPINPISPTYSSISASTDKVIPELYGTDSGSFITVNINKYNIELLEFLKDQLNDKFCVSAYGLFSTFGALYYGSNGSSESEIRDHFGMVSKDNINDGLNFLKKIYDKPNLHNQLIFKNILFINNELPVNKDLIKYLNPIIDIYPISARLSEKETHNINNYINKLSNGTIEPLSGKVLAKTQILCVSLAMIKPIWKQPFDKTFDAKFNGIKSRTVRMLGQVDKQYEYYEDNLNQIIEFKCQGDIYSMGIILPKEFVIPGINHDEFNNLVKNIKTTHLDEVVIPAFTQQIKIKLTNLLYQNGLQTVFQQLAVPELVKTSTNISDVVQNLTVIVSNNSNNTNNTRKNVNLSVSNIKFIANHPFIYYFKLLATNTIILIGYYG